MKMTPRAATAVACFVALGCDVFAAPCDMSKLAPVLASVAMTKCTVATAFEIPHIQPFARGYTRASDQICLSAACGNAIQAIQKAQAEECDLSAANAIRSLVGVTAKLYAQHLNPVFDICDQEPSLFGPTVTPVADAMGEFKVCTHAAVASFFWGTQSSLEECIGVPLKSLVSSSRNASGEQLIVCPACEIVQNATSTLPTCHVAARNMSFRDMLEHAFSYCDAIGKFDVGEGITGALADQLKNSSVACDFDSQAMQLVLDPVRNDLFENPNCTALLYDPAQPLSSEKKQVVCEMCPLAKHAVKTIELPLCQTRFGLSYAQYLLDAVANCEEVDTSVSSSADSPNSSSRDGQAAEKSTVPTPTPSSSTTHWSPTLSLPLVIAVLVNWVC